MQKKKKQTKEEMTAENFFPIAKSDAVYTTEKPVKEASMQTLEMKDTIERIVKPQPNVIEILKRTVEKKSKPKKSIQKIEKISKKKKEINLNKTLKKDGFELIITEKPQAALKIASALGNPIKREQNKVPYYEIERDGKKIVVACAVGHLFTLKQNESGSKVPIFNIDWVPNYLAIKGDFTKRYYDNLSNLANKAGSIIVATDFDVEGELIGLNVVRYICGQKDASRMKFSTLTKDELNQAYENKSSSLEWGQAIAGETRHFLDWFYGINLSRALMNAIKTTGRFKLMSIGRVQGPTLKLIVDKEREIGEFKSEPYWQVFINVSDKKNELELKYIKDIFNKQELEKFSDIDGKKVNLSTQKKIEELKPLPPFNLTELQKEAYKFHGITPTRTLQAAQALYLAGLISYPRTSSQKLPPSIGYEKILEKLSKQYNCRDLIKRNVPIEGEKTDPAHPSIYPTAQTNEIPVLSDNEEKIYNLIVKRFLSLFCENAILENKRVKAELNELTFAKSGSTISRKAWLEIYPSKLKEEKIPDMNGEGEILSSRIEEKETQPPKRYSPASILSELEKRNLGTKATRASILETLYQRGYVKDESIKATPLGNSLISTLEKYSPIIINEELTRDFEKEMEDIESSKAGYEIKKDKIIDKAKSKIIDISQDFKKNEEKIGKELLNANDRLIEERKKEDTIMPCPECKNGNIIINYSKKNRRYFLACDAYPNCKKTYSLPPERTFKKTNKNCQCCNSPLLMGLKKGKRPWIFCFNPNCESRQKKEESNPVQ